MLVLAGLLLGRWVWKEQSRVWSEPRGGSAPVAAEAGGLPSLAPIVRKVRAGVVGIRTLRRRAAGGEVAGDGEHETGGVANGTGFIIHDSGLAVTNYHLVANSERIVLEVPGCRPVEAQLVGVDPVTDIAVVRFEPPPSGLTVLKLGDSTRIEQGDWVLAVGNPFQYRHTVTVGIVSYVGRHIPDTGLLVSNEYLQFSAPVHPGSSGGPVLDMEGNVVGVTTSAHAKGTGISFAVPTKVLKWVLRTMNESDGRVRRGFLGVGLEPLDDVTRDALGLESGGALVGYVEKGRPAHRAGVRAGDVVVSYNGRAVPDAYALFDWITYSKPGGEVGIDVLRNGGRVPTMVAQLGEVEVDYEQLEEEALEPAKPDELSQ